MFYAHTCSCARANDVKIMCSGDVQCNTEESPQGLGRGQIDRM